MNKIALTAIAAILAPALSHAGANCQSSSSWQCQHRGQNSGVTGTQPQVVLPPVTAQPGGTTPPLGSLPPNNNIVVLTPIPGKTITGYGPAPTVTSTLGPGFTGTRPPEPIVVTGTPGPTVVGYGHPQPITPTPTPSFTGTRPPEPIVVTGTPGPTITGVAPVPTVTGTPEPGFTGTRPPEPIVVTGTPGPTITGVAPVSTVTGTPEPGFTGTGTPPTQPVQPATHALVIHEPPQNRPVTSGDHIGPEPYSLEFIEPGIQNHKVEVYRSKDVRQVTYRDTNPLDSGDFHLRVIGTKNPAYSH